MHDHESLPGEEQGRRTVIDWTFLFVTVMNLAGWILLSPLPVVFLLVYWLVARKTPARWAGVLWLCLGVGLQAIYWRTHYAPIVPLVVPSAWIAILLSVTAAGVWRLARARGFHPWKWSLLACLPALGPILAFVRLATRTLHDPTEAVVFDFCGHGWGGGTCSCAWP